jgi:hypothetical protein
LLAQPAQGGLDLPALQGRQVILALLGQLAIRAQPGTQVRPEPRAQAQRFWGQPALPDCLLPDLPALPALHLQLLVLRARLEGLGPRGHQAQLDPPGRPARPETLLQSLVLPALPVPQGPRQRLPVPRGLRGLVAQRAQPAPPGLHPQLQDQPVLPETPAQLDLPAYPARPARQALTAPLAQQAYLARQASLVRQALLGRQARRASKETPGPRAQLVTLELLAPPVPLASKVILVPLARLETLLPTLARLARLVLREILVLPALPALLHRWLAHLVQRGRRGLSARG